MKVVSDKRAEDATAKLQKEKELSKVKVSKDDIDLIVSFSYFSFTCINNTVESDREFFL